MGYGIYDSKKIYTQRQRTPERSVRVFEFDYYLSCDKDAVCHLDNHTYKLQPNVLIFRKPGQVSSSTLHFKTLYVHIEIEKDSPFYDELLRLPAFFSFLHPETYRTIFENIIFHNFKDGSSFDDYYTVSKLLELFYYLQKDAPHNQNTANQPFQKENACVQKAVEYLKKHYSEKITLKTLGSLTGYSPHHFRHIFQEIMHISPQKYLEDLRLSQAKYLLAQNELTIAEIAYACGFSSQAYFSLLFKRSTYLTPNEFRQTSAKGYPD